MFFAKTRNEDGSLNGIEIHKRNLRFFRILIRNKNLKYS
jgi:hypothetical protein